MISSALVPLLTAIANGAACLAPNAASKRRVFGPSVSDPLDSASSIIASAWARSSGPNTMRAAAMGESELWVTRPGHGAGPVGSPEGG